MKFFIFVLILASLFQTSFLPINLVLMLLIARELVYSTKANLYLAFGAGILLGLLSPQNIGFAPFIFLIVVKLVSFLRKLPFTTSFLTVLPISFVIFLSTAFIEQQVFKINTNIYLIILQSVLMLPVYFLTKMWEERFVVSKDIKLKL